MLQKFQGLQLDDLKERGDEDSNVLRSQVDSKTSGMYSIILFGRRLQLPISESQLCFR